MVKLCFFSPRHQLSSVRRPDVVVVQVDEFDVCERVEATHAHLLKFYLNLLPIQCSRQLVPRRVLCHAHVEEGRLEPLERYRDVCDGVEDDLGVQVLGQVVVQTRFFKRGDTFNR